MADTERAAAERERCERTFRASKYMQVVYAPESFLAYWDGWQAARAQEAPAPTLDPRLKATPYGPAILLDYVRDAERYRWLREQPNNTDAPRIDVVYWTQEDESVNGGEGLRMDALDAAIDAAIAAATKGQTP